MDKFHEQLLRTEKSILYKLLQFSMVFSVVLLVLFLGSTFGAFNFMSILTVIVLGLLAFGSKILRDKQYREYEYVFTNGNLQIDIIYNQRKRKTLFDIDVKNFDEFGKASDVNTSNAKEVICIPWNNKNERYVFLTSENGKQAVFIAPDEEILKLIRLYAVKRNKF